MRQAIIELAVSVAKSHDLDAALLCAVMQVESGGTPTYADGSPVILCESLHFYRLLPAGKRAAALKAGLATTRAPKDYEEQRTPAQRIARLQAMVAIDREAGYGAVSMGLGQVLGENHASLGYPTAEAMYEAFRDPLAQVEGIYRFLEAHGALAPMKAHDWKSVAAIYNGKGYVRFHYDRKLADAFAHWSVAFRSGQTQPPAEGVGLGSKGDAVRAIQKELAATGYPTRVDGIFGPGTMKAVAGFQAHHGLPGNGIVDQTTADTLFAKPPVPQGARELATRASLAKTSRIVSLARKAKQVHWLGAAGTTSVVGLANLDTISGAVDKADQARDLYGKVHDLVTDTGGSVYAWAVAHPGIAASVAAFGLVTFVVSRMLGGIEDARVDDERSGATT